MPAMVTGFRGAGVPPALLATTVGRSRGHGGDGRCALDGGAAVGWARVCRVWISV